MLPDHIESNTPVDVARRRAGSYVEISGIDFTNSSAPHLFEVRTISLIPNCCQEFFTIIFSEA